MSFYAVAKGKKTGVFSSWDQCNEQVKGFKNCVYKKFKNKDEAEIFISKYNSTDNKIYKHDFIPDYFVYTDGACSNNGYSNSLAGIGIFFKINDSRNVSKKLLGKQTNNTAELNAIIDTFTIIENDIKLDKKIVIVSDSEYAISCANSYGKRCSNKNWDIYIPNKKLVQKIYDLYKNINIKFMHIKAHTNNTDIHSIGNDNADKLANQAINLKECPYTKIFFNIPYNKKEEFKKLGGLWDSNKKKWFVYESNKNIFDIKKTYNHLVNFK